MDEQQPYRNWIAEGLKKPGKGKRKLADALGVDPSAVTRILDGTRQVKLHELPKIAAYLEEPAPESDGFYEPEATYEEGPGTVPVRGYVGAGAMAFYLPQEVELDRVEAPPGSTDATIALEIRGTSLGELFDRWLVFLDDIRTPVTPDLIGKTCVVGLTDGRVLVKKLKRAGGGLFDLLSNTEEPIRSVAVEWAARVKTMAPR